ncbi:MAG: uncharacterized protein K0S09_54 [Sphingobacteriaceae bacterium]|jgi:hypothetical protein|nr:uncharacterized protein [Sphingobacteriaceae bacterium]
MATKTHWRKYDKTEFLGAVDLDEMTPSEIIATIEKVEWKEAKVRGAKGMFRIATFRENIKPMIINVENGKILQSFVGGSKHLEDWVNIPVQIYIKENVRMGSETMDALRFRPNKPQLQKVDNTGALKILNACTSLEDLQREYLAFSKPIQADKEVRELKDDLKARFTKEMQERVEFLNSQPA